MRSVPRRAFVAAGLATATLARPALAGAPIEILSSAFPPLTIDDAARPGFVNDVLRQMLKLIGAEARLTYVPWADAQRRAREETGRLITPLARIASREPHFSWLVKVFDIEHALGARGQALDLEGGRKVARLGVLRGSLHQDFLQRQGFNNLVEFGALPDVMTALLDGKIDALFSNSADIVLLSASLGRRREVTMGPTLTTTPIFIASGRDTGSLPKDQLQEAFAALEQDGTVAALHREYYGQLATG